MLQQTQVSTVIPYFDRFVNRFPTVRSLAEAEQDEVLHLWTGLGYYARARNLHKAAQIIHSDYNDKFPTDFEQVLALPGIGRSTAGAILAQACNQRHPILDGNVKRVLTRLHAIEGWPGNKKVETELWQLAEKYTPHENIVDYTQAIMDLGATVCTRRAPDCPGCPLHDKCEAFRQERVKQFPTPKPRKTLPVKSARMLMLFQNKSCLLEQRPATGIWGNLWSFPECPNEQEPAAFIRHAYGLEPESISSLSPLRHTFSHFHLDIEPLLIQVKYPHNLVMDNDRLVWYNTLSPDQRGLPAPVVKLLEISSKICQTFELEHQE